MEESKGVMMEESQEKEENFKLPVKRVEGENLEERLTENTYDRILPARYLIKDVDGNITETPEEMFQRVAENIAEPEKEYGRNYEETVEEFYELMTNLEFMPNSPTLMNAGAELQQLSACFVIQPEDDLDSIFDSVHDAAKIFQSGGGVGYPFHLIRPKGDRVKSTGGIASGPLSFMKVYDKMCETIKQGGKRRGAQMGVMKVDHPDILRFIVAKREEGVLSNFNISVGITEEFMEAVKNDEEYTFYNPRTEKPHEVSEKNCEFYNRDEDWYPQEQGSDSEKEKNFWRDYSENVKGVDQFDINLEPGEKMTLPARFIWKVMIDSAWRNGEPGIFMYDRSNKMHSFDVSKHSEHKIESTNPCVTGETLINTEEGIYTAKELYEDKEDLDIIVDERLSEEKTKKASEVFKTGVKDVYRLNTEEGYEIRLTDDHKLMTDSGWKEAKDLNEGELVHILNREASFGKKEKGSKTKGRLLGWIVGDGQIKNSEETTVLHFYGNDTDLSSEFSEYINEIAHDNEGNEDNQSELLDIESNEDAPKEQRVISEGLYEITENYGLKENKLQVPEQIFKYGKEMARGFLQGLFTSEGRVQGSAEEISVTLSSSELNLLKEVQQVLLGFGIPSKLYEERREESRKELPNEKRGKKNYENKSHHDLVIEEGALKKFKSQIGFLREDKTNNLENKLEDYVKEPNVNDYTATVKSLEYEGKEEVFDLTEPDTHSFIANGFVVHNCGEQPLENFEVCNLGHVNLSLMVDSKENGSGLEFQQWVDERDYDIDSDEELDEAISDFLEEALRMDKLESVVKTATKFLDNVVTMSDFPLEEIEQKAKSTRKIGLGLMGFAQMLIQLGIRYGSRESIAVSKEIQRLLTRFSVEKSHELAKERGEFSEWEKSKWADPTNYEEWFRKYSGGMDPEDYDDGFSMRNHNTTTIAPTGTTSMIANTSGGCEPIFSLAYFKNVGKDIQGEEMLVEFDDYFLKALKSNGVDVQEVKDKAIELMKNNEWKGVDSLPDDILPPRVKEIFSTANNVTPNEHVKIQTAFQEHNHSAISKTCNFPNEATREDVEEAYMLAYERGAKGLTVYRDGSRNVQVMTTRGKSPEEMEKEELIDLLEDKYGSFESILQSSEFKDRLEEENFIVRSQSKDKEIKRARERPKTVSGTTQKINTGYGSLFVTINEDQEGLFEVFTIVGKSGGFTQSFTDSMGRLISTSLRAGVDPEEIIDQLKGIRSPKSSWDNGEKIHSIPDAVGKAMERYISGKARNVQTSVEDFSSEEAEDNNHFSLGDLNNEEKEETEESGVQDMIDKGKNPECPECGAIVEYTEGCVTCPNCGWSECD